jgi:large subunit ribosomal protein L49
MSQPPEPLKFKLQELPTPDNTWNQPLGLAAELPFTIERTHSNNLPVYTDLRNGGMRKLTVVRKISGDINEFKAELSKIVSNSPIEEKMGRIEISGQHSEKVKLWLRRLGF